MELLGAQQVDDRLAGGAWTREGDTIQRELELADFEAALALVDAVGAAAQAADHHPDILLHGWNHVRLTLSTHSAGGLTAADLALAATIDALPQASTGVR